MPYHPLGYEMGQGEGPLKPGQRCRRAFIWLHKFLEDWPRAAKHTSGVRGYRSLYRVAQWVKDTATMQTLTSCIQDWQQCLQCHWTLQTTQMISSSFLFVTLLCKSCPEGIYNEGNSLGPSVVAHHAHPPCLTC